VIEGKRREGEEVIVKPPAFGIDGTCTSSHWPGRNYQLRENHFII